MSDELREVLGRLDRLEERVDDLEFKAAPELPVTSDDEELRACMPDLADGQPWPSQFPVWTNKVICDLADTYTGDHNVPVMFITADHATSWEMIRQISWNTAAVRMQVMWGVTICQPGFMPFYWYFPDPATDKHRLYPAKRVRVPHTFFGLELGLKQWAEKVDGTIDFKLNSDKREFDDGSTRYVWQHFHRYVENWIQHRSIDPPPVGGVEFSPS